jgi:transcriptional antiterminator NusG
MTPKDQAKIIEAAERPEEPVLAVSSFKAGDKVKVTEGPFVNFEGTVEEVIADKGTVKIIATIFGRPTTLELEYWQIEKL